jgi:Domain of unknown function (DUF4249)
MVHENKKTDLKSLWIRGLGVVCALGLLTACEDILTNLNVPQGAQQLVVEANITNLAGTQRIKLSRTQDALDNSPVLAATGATVTVSDNEGNTYAFVDSRNNGEYIWTPSGNQAIGRVGRKYTLNIQLDGERYTASTEMKRVPKLDSILYEFEDAPDFRQQQSDTAVREGYEAQFYARDFAGEGDCYRIKAYHNNKQWAGPDNIILAYDAAFQAGARADGLMFILPIRRAISPQLYKEKDRIKVELYSLTEDNYYFWFQFRRELNNRGLFARPPASIPTNVRNVNSASARQAVGWFGASAVSVLETVVDKNQARTGLE